MLISTPLPYSHAKHTGRKVFYKWYYLGHFLLSFVIVGEFRDGLDIVGRSPLMQFVEDCFNSLF
ncbi:MAG: hypothetical protein F6K22_19815 [Okeania sp. SIO2F4]|uniref:hypothetical protein n=1 Tax=Okeania sp. SIO2F4 TaxID=2607790 RepID=UPI00142CEB7E|nr:hypothetical protein [Okeania sp. SIO2F4]NES04883.1 hypothetical protein [Okeania sp. SIO2F4]